jgi:uncharacterized membrane-anchored protein
MSIFVIGGISKLSSSVSVLWFNLEHGLTAQGFSFFVDPYLETPSHLYQYQTYFVQTLETRAPMALGKKRGNHEQDHLLYSSPKSRGNSSMITTATDRLDLAKTMFSKVPEVTVYFWIIKVLATTIGETAADFLNTNFNLGLTGTTFIMAGLLIVALFFQFRLQRYVPSVYWLAVVLISVVGTLITDNLVDNFGVSLQTTTILFAVALAISFFAWYQSEKTLSIHSIFTTKREAFYWLAVLFTFALGTAAGDLMAEGLALGYWKSALMFAGMIGVVALAHVFLKLPVIPTFWIAYILTRPLGASVGDFLSQDKTDGGLQLGTMVTSGIFLVAILAVVIFLTVTKRDLEAIPENTPA